MANDGALKIDAQVLCMSSGTEEEKLIHVDS